MRMRRDAAILASVAAMTVAGLMTVPGSTQAWAFGAGGTAPGGPLSGGIRPACNGYEMDGTPTRGGCDGRSVDERAAASRPAHTR